MIWVGVIGCAFVGWWVSRPTPPPTISLKGWPLPGYRFLREPAIWLEVGLSPEQVHTLYSMKPLRDVTGAEKQRFGDPATNGMIESEIREARVEASFTPEQRKRYQELQYQDADVLIAEIPEVAARLDLKPAQKQTLDDILHNFAQRRAIWRQRAVEDVDDPLTVGVTPQYPSEALAALERATIRQVLDPGQQGRLEMLMGQPGPDKRCWASHGILDEDQVLIAVFGKQAWGPKIGVSAEAVRAAMHQGNLDAAEFQASGFEADAYVALRLWKLMSPEQKQRYHKLAFSLQPVYENVLRADCAAMLGIPQDERDRLAVLFAERSQASFYDSSLRRASELMFNESPSNGKPYDWIDRERPTITRGDGVEFLIWSFLRKETRDKYLQLGGQPPRELKTGG